MSILYSPGCSASAHDEPMTAFCFAASNSLGVGHFQRVPKASGMILCVMLDTRPWTSTLPIRHPILGIERDVRVLDLHRDRHNHRVVGHLHIVRAHIEQERRPGQDLRVRHELFQVLELDRRRRHDLRRQVQPVELLVLFLLAHRAGAKLLKAAPAVEPVLLVRLATLLSLRQPARITGRLALRINSAACARPDSSTLRIGCKRTGRGLAASKSKIAVPC